jgi:hypothetical protein
MAAAGRGLGTPVPLQIVDKLKIVPRFRIAGTRDDSASSVDDGRGLDLQVLFAEKTATGN